MEHIFLIGFMGAGKSTVGRELARLLHRRLLDLDAYIVEKEGMPVSEIFETYGEAHFRERETACLKELAGLPAAVIPCGGGVVLKKENVAVLKEGGTIVLLEAAPETILERVRRNDRRPLLRGKKNLADIEKMMEERLPYYRGAADLIVRSEQYSTRELAAEIAERLGLIEKS